MYRRIVVPLDGSALAETILPEVRRLVSDTGIEIVLLAVGPLPSPLAMARRLRELEALQTPPPADLDALIAREEHALQATEECRLGQYLDGHAAALEAAGVHARTRVRLGDPATEIVRCADEEHADAVAMSTHGRSGLHSLMHGSVAGSVLHASPLPVLLLRPATEAFARQQAAHVDDRTVGVGGAEPAGA